MRGAPLYVDGNDDEAEATVSRTNATTGLEEAATGLTGLTFRLSATRGGATIHATLSKSATERGTTGVYFAIYEGSDLTAQLANATYIGKDIYEVFGDGANVNTNVVRRVMRHRP